MVLFGIAGAEAAGDPAAAGLPGDSLHAVEERNDAMCNDARGLEPGLEDLLALSAPVRDAIELVQFGYEKLVIDLLDGDRGAADFDWQLARDQALKAIKIFPMDGAAPDHELQAKRVALAAMGRAFDRLAATFGHDEGADGSPICPADQSPPRL